MIHITLDMAKEAMDWAVGQKPYDYIYINPRSGKEAPHCSCTYADSDGAPSCIVGYVLRYIGVDVRWASDIGASIRTIATHAKLKGIFTIDPDALKFLTVAQVAQDGGCTWSNSLTAAEAAVSTDYTL